MQSLLGFQIHARPPEVIRHAVNTEAMDWFVIATLCFFFFLLGCFATAAWCLWRRCTRPQPHVRLLMELAESDEERVIHQADEGSQGYKRDQKIADEWEKPPDWWKL